MVTELAMSSWETIFHRSLMMAQGTCSPAEYQRMVMEKAAAIQASTLALMTGRGHAAALAPYLVRSRANARRLRRGYQALSRLTASSSSWGASASLRSRRKLRTLNGSIAKYSKLAPASAAQGSATATAA